MSDSSLSTVGNMCSPTRSSSPDTNMATVLGTQGAMSPSKKARKTLKADPIPTVVKLSESKGAKHLDKSFTKDNTPMFFTSYTASTSAIGQAVWQPPTPDPTIPQTTEDEQTIVRSLYNALRDLDSANDTEKSPYRKRFLANKDTSYADWQVEACAWEILKLVKDLHTTGFKTPIFDATLLVDIGQTENWTFEDRIGMICRILSNSKNTAVGMMKREKVWTIIGSPHKLYQSNLVNTASNKDRNMDVKRGRAGRKEEEEAWAPKKKAKTSAPEPVVAKLPDRTACEDAELLLSLRVA